MKVVLACFLFAAVFSALAVGMFLVSRRIYSTERRKHATTVASAYFNTIGTIYAVVLGFMLFHVWTQFQEAASGVDQEAAAVSSMVRMSQGFSPEVQSQMRAAAEFYATAMVQHEWPAMRTGDEASQGNGALDRIWAVIISLNPQSNAQSQMYGEMLEVFNQLARQRRIRLMRAYETLPTILWVVLWVGALVTVGFSCLFGMDDDKMHIVKIVALTATVAIVVFAIWEVYGPFEGLVSVSPRAFELLLGRLHTGVL